MGKEEKADGDVITKTLTFTGSAMAIFFSLKFLLTKIVTIFSGDSDDPWQSLWDQILEITGDDFFTHHVYGTNLFMNLMFFGLGGIYIFFDLTNQPAFLRKYKVIHHERGGQSIRILKFCNFRSSPEQMSLCLSSDSWNSWH